jgi:DNA-entry nuclease
MEAWSVEDNGAGVCFSVFAYNVQPGVSIDYKTGNSWLSDEEPPAPEEEPSDPSEEESEAADYVLNTKSRRFHLPTCSSVATIAEKNRKDYHGSRDDLLSDDFVPCGTCKP